jgi:AraC-like DNA-binding protein
VRSQFGCHPGQVASDLAREIYQGARNGRPIEVAAIAGIAGRSPFHFTRVFTQSGKSGQLETEVHAARDLGYEQCVTWGQKA